MINKYDVTPTHVTCSVAEKTYAVPIERCEDIAPVEVRQQLQSLSLEGKKEKLRPYAEQFALKTGNQFLVVE